MRLRTFVAPSLAQAKDKVRAELGDDAVIISTVTRPGGGVEIKAAIDGARQAAPKNANRAALNNELERRIALQVLEHLRSDLSGEKRVAENAASAAMREQARSAPTAKDISEALRALLVRHGFGEALSASLARAAEKVDEVDPGPALTAAIETEFKFAPVPIAPPRPIMLIGQTGAGKTSTTAKLTARAMMAGEKVTVIGADAARAGAVEQIKTYADALEASFWTAESPDALRSAVAAEKSANIIIDAPGVSAFDKDEIGYIRELAEVANAEPILVLPASGDREEYDDLARIYYAFGVRRMIVTKIDAARRIGPALAAAQNIGMSIAHFGVSPFIAEGLETASAERLAARLLQGGEDEFKRLLAARKSDAPAAGEAARAVGKASAGSYREVKK
ncbi:MAG: flagellar biosynthesis protein FlhF [Parvularculaceae bacterium]